MTHNRRRLLVIDDRPNMLKLMEKIMSADMQVYTASSGNDGLRVLMKQPVEVILCDLKMPDLSGLEVLKTAKRTQPQAEFILMTAYATVDTAVEAIKLGAYEYITKPFEPEVARTVILRALAHSERKNSPTDEVGDKLPLKGVITHSPGMKAAADMARKFSKSDMAVLLQGEGGTGKRMLARAIHSLRHNSSESFVDYNCSVPDSEQMADDLFGSQGHLRRHHEGTLFLGSVHDMPLELQAKLAALLESRDRDSVSRNPEHASLRVIVASDQNLEALRQEKLFREDLWYTLNAAKISVPALRDRREDIEALAQYFFFVHNQKSPSKKQGISRSALEVLLGYRWPGNVRQLRSVIERACTVANGLEIEISDLSPELTQSPPTPTELEALPNATWAQALKQGRADAGRRYLEALMQHFEGKVAEAAIHAGVERESFYRLLRRHGIDPTAYRPD